MNAHACFFALGSGGGRVTVSFGAWRGAAGGRGHGGAGEEAAQLGRQGGCRGSWSQGLELRGDEHVTQGGIDCLGMERLIFFFFWGVGLKL